MATSWSKEGAPVMDYNHSLSTLQKQESAVVDHWPCEELSFLTNYTTTLVSLGVDELDYTPNCPPMPGYCDGSMR